MCPCSILPAFGVEISDSVQVRGNSDGDGFGQNSAHNERLCEWEINE